MKKRARKHLRVEPFIKKLGNRIRSLRKLNELTLEQLAANCDIEYVQLSRIERGLINTSVSHVYVIAKELGVSCSELFDFK
jgi:transcriptional regulator with XRE-family HTH domain